MSDEISEACARAIAAVRPRWRCAHDCGGLHGWSDEQRAERERLLQAFSAQAAEIDRLTAERDAAVEALRAYPLDALNKAELEIERLKHGLAEARAMLELLERAVEIAW